MRESPEGHVAAAARLCAEGYACIESRQFERARALLERARELAPADARIYYNLGLLYSDQGCAADALAAFVASLRINPDDAKAHNNRGSALQILRRYDEADDAFHRAIALRPDLELPYVNLGKLLETRGDVPAAVTIYDIAVGRGLDSQLFSQYRAAALGHSTVRCPDTWVTSTFDNFAPTFDAHLAQLQYHVPQRLATLVLAHCREPLAILDLGCGTGLVGAALAGHGHHLVGVDLSAKMLAQARDRGIYERLDLSEIHAWLNKAAPDSFAAICAADVFIYIGALETIFTEAERLLRQDGWFAFSTEECTDIDYKLLATGRYAQSEDYIRRLAAAAFDIVTASPVTIRVESGAPLQGRIYLLRKR